MRLINARQSAFWRWVVSGQIFLLVGILLFVTFSDSACVLQIAGLSVSSVNDEDLTFNVCVATLLGLGNKSSKNEVLKFLGIGVAGLILLLQALIANDRAESMRKTAEAQGSASTAQAKVMEQQAKANQLTERGLRQQRLQNGVEHLGRRSESVRLGGAYQLFHLAQDALSQDTGGNELLRQTVLDILCAHIRWTTRDGKYQRDHSSEPSEEIQSLLNLLFVQEHGVFTGLRINLQESWLNGTDLQKARLWGADLRRASLNKAILDDAQLQKVIFLQAHLKEASFHRACFREACLVNAEMQGAKLPEAQLQGANIYGGDLTIAFLAAANLQGANLSHAKMYATSLVYTNMQGVSISQAFLQTAIFDNANLQGADNDDWKPSVSFADRIRKLIGKTSNLSHIDNGQLTQEHVEQLVGELYSLDEEIELRNILGRHVDKPYYWGLPKGHNANIGSYTEQDAQKWIAEHEAAMKGRTQG